MWFHRHNWKLEDILIEKSGGYDYLFDVSTPYKFKIIERYRCSRDVFHIKHFDTRYAYETLEEANSFALNLRKKNKLGDTTASGN